MILMTDQNLLSPDIEKLRAILHGLSMTQIRFVIARLENKTDKAAAEAIQITPATVKSWDNKEQVDIITALEIRRRNLAKAMAVKVAGLESDNEKIRQDTATELIEWELGKAQQKTDITTAGEKLNRIEIAPYDYINAIAPLAPRSVDDSNPSGQNESASDGETVG
jgi:hypothetical protein